MALRPMGTLGLGLAARRQCMRPPLLAFARPLHHLAASQTASLAPRSSARPLSQLSPSSARVARPSPIASLALSIRPFSSTGTSIRRNATPPQASIASAAAAPSSSSSSSSSSSDSKPTSKWVGYHSLFLAFLVYTIVVVGGLTRLTESGLSITEWNPGFKGMWLPTSDEEWEGEWAKYRQTPEFVLLNSKMSLEDFKTIYMWEWSHRILGRVIGLAYILPAAFFVARGMVKSPFRSKLLLIGLGIGAQGAMGWYMVKSGLAAPQGTLHVSEEAAKEGKAGEAQQQQHSDALAPPKSATPASWTPRVSHFRLAAHLGLAFLVYAGMLRTGLSVLRQYNLAMNVGSASGLKAVPGVREKLVAVLSKPQVVRYRRFAGVVTGLVFLTAMSGALVAGLDAGLVYNEFPTMGDGRIAPPLDEMFDERYARSSSGNSNGDATSSSSSLVLHNLTQNPVTVQFVHRCLAITTFAHVALLAYKTRNLSSLMRVAGTPLPPAVPRLAYLALATATMQATLGITTLIYMVPIELASAHQAGSVALLSVMLALWGTLRVPGTVPVASAVNNVKRAANVAAAASTGSATAASAAAGSPSLARSIHTSPRIAKAPSKVHARGLATSAAAFSRLRTLSELPDKVMLKTGPAGRLAKILPARSSHDITTRVGSSYGGNHSLEWLEPPRNLLVVTKRHDEEVREALRRLVSHVNQTYPEMNIVIEPHNAAALQDLTSNLIILPTSPHATTASPPLSSKIDLIITLGGDGTILHASSLFSHSPVPPVLSFSMGTLGFLLPWDFEAMREALKDVVESKVTLLLRMRLRLTVHEGDGALVVAGAAGSGVEGAHGEVHLMNEVTLHRGSQPHMTTIDAYVDGNHLTQAISDGLIISSPTGSTAYSLSAGGPIVHPSVQSLLLTPICPRSLSFRPLVLPSDSTVQLRVSGKSRSPAEITVDGRLMGEEEGSWGEEVGGNDGMPRMLKPGQYLQVSMSPYPIPCVNRGAMSAAVEGGETRGSTQRDPGSAKSAIATSGGGAGAGAGTDRGEDDWVRDINRLLRFNASFAKRPRDDD